MKKILALCSLVCLSACSLMGIRDTPEPRYQLLLKDNAFEIRQYSPLLLAQTVVTADYQQAGSEAFKRLARYIFGGNTARTRMDMNSPVIQEGDSVTIAMTAPVLQQAEGQVWRMSFVMPDSYTLETLPVPDDDRVELKQQSAQKTAVLVYSGSLNAQTIAEKTQVLREWLTAHSLKPISSARSAAYDPPWTLSAMRKNEIHIDIE